MQGYSSLKVHISSFTSSGYRNSKKKSSCHNFMMCGVKMFNAEQSRHNHIATLDGENTFADPVLHVTHNLYVVSSLSVRL